MEGFGVSAECGGLGTKLVGGGVPVAVMVVRRHGIGGRCKTGGGVGLGRDTWRKVLKGQTNDEMYVVASS